MSDFDKLSYKVQKKLLTCPYCGSQLIKVYYEEEEEKFIDKYVGRKPTGRIRLNVSHLECDVCGAKQPVDGDTFAEDWH